MHGMTPNWLWTLNRYSVCTKDLLMRLKFWSVLTYDKHFARYKVAENWKSTEWPQTELEHFKFKSILHTLDTSVAQIWSVLPYDKRFSRYKAAENRRCTEWPQTELKHLTVQRTMLLIQGLTITTLTTWRDVRRRDGTERYWRNERNVV